MELKINLNTLNRGPRKPTRGGKHRDSRFKRRRTRSAQVQRALAEQ